MGTALGAVHISRDTLLGGGGVSDFITELIHLFAYGICSQKYMNKLVEQSHSSFSLGFPIIPFITKKYSTC
jgi:hypothetical protein